MSIDNPVVLDAGSCTFKAGISLTLPCEEEPSVIAPSFVRDMSVGGQVGAGPEVHAVESGDVSDWDAYEAILDNILYKKLGWKVGEEGALLAGESLFTPRASRERLTQLAFEHNNVAGFILYDEALLSLYSVGRLSGCVVDLGHNKIDVVTVADNQISLPSARRLPFGMHNLSQHLAKILGAGGVPAGGLSQPALSLLRDSVLKVSSSAAEAKEMLAQGEAAVGESHSLPDGQVITVKGEGVELGEVLLDQRRAGGEGPSLAECVTNACVTNLEPAARKVAAENLLICGGGSAVAGLAPRLLHEVRLHIPPALAPSLLQSPDYMPPTTPQLSVWMGGVVLSKMVFQQGQHVTKQEYDEVGPTVIHKRCS